MVQILIAKVIGKAIMRVIEKADDKRIARKHHREIKELKKEVKDLKKNSHSKSDWICLECGCKAKKVEKPTRNKRKRKLKKEK